MTNSAESLPIANKAQADMLFEMVSKTAATGPDARTLAELYEAAKIVRDKFASGT